MFLSIFTNSKYSFEGEKSYENVIVLLYRHWLTIFVKFIFFILAAILPFVLNYFAKNYFTQVGLADFFCFLISVYFLFWWAGLFYAITMYLLDTWIITDHRILDNEQHGFFKRTLAEMNLSRIQDTSVSVTGLIPTFFNFGNLEIQTAGTEPKFVFKQIPGPNKVKGILTETFNNYTEIHKDGIEVHEHRGV